MVRQATLPQPSAPLAGPLPRFLEARTATGTTTGHGGKADASPIAELDCLRHGSVAPGQLKWAASRSEALQIGADRILIHHGLIAEADYLDRLSLHTGVVHERLIDVARSDCPLRDDQLQRAAQQGVVPLRDKGELVWIIAPRGLTARRLCRFALMFPEHRHRIRIATSDDLSRFLLQQAHGAMATAAADGLQAMLPDLSAAPVKRPPGRLIPAAVIATAFTMPVVIPGLMALALSVFFLIFAAFRLGASLLPKSEPRALPRLPDSELPTYSIIAALYREASSVAALIAAFDRFDYPKEKLDIILAVEPNDLETRAAIARLGVRHRIRTIIAPAHGPQTKPKALNFALPFAQGTFVAIYDAEDRPEPGQLRAALDGFRTGGEEVACVQASLCIDNPEDGWLSCMFAAEYAGQFDIFLQGLSHAGSPIPLGGSSNHFRASVLREIGAWDAYNVTEDADLGFRLARFGYRSAMFRSTTFEEAPSKFWPWLRQRSRWMKGWMQTWLVHMRAPRRLWRDGGMRAFVTLNLVVGGNVLTALAHPFLLGAVAIEVTARLSGQPAVLLSGRFAAIHLAAIVLGYVAAALIGLAGFAKRGMLSLSAVLLLMPLYWIGLSAAAWRALYQLLTDPYRWEKTEHGLARSAWFTRSQATRPAAIRDSA